MRKPLLALLVLLAGPAAAQERAADHPYSAPVALDAPGSHYRFAMPAAAYRGAARRDLGDLRVFNGAGEPVPYAFATRDTQPAPAATRAVSLFPLYGEAGSDLDATSVRVERNSRGAVVKVSVASAARVTPAKRSLLGYLVDASAIKEPKEALLLEWNAGEGFSGQARVEGSDDLKNWRTLAANAPVLLLEHGGARLERKRVELAGARAKYLRVSFGGVPRNFALKEVRVELRGDRPEAAREWLALPARDGKARGELMFDTAGHFPVDRLRLALPQLNTVAQVQILTRNRQEDAWRFAQAATAYRLRGDSGDIVNPDIVVQANPDRYWLLKVDQKGGGFGAGEVRLDLGWVPHEVVFAARGAAPFSLAYGSASAKPGALSMAAVLPGGKADELKLVKPAKVGDISGAAPPAVSVFRDPAGFVRGLAQSGEGKKWLLWSALVAGVLLLAWMALRLLRETGK